MEKKRIHPILLLTRQLVIDEHQTLVSEKTCQVQVRTIQSILPILQAVRDQCTPEDIGQRLSEEHSPFGGKEKNQSYPSIHQAVSDHLHQTLVSKKTPRVQIRTIHSILQFIKRSEINLLQRT